MIFDWPTCEVAPAKPATGVITGLPQEKIVLVGILDGKKLKLEPLQIAASVVSFITGIGFTLTINSNGLP